MERLDIAPRADWRTRVESQGLHFHTTEDVPYWNEAACYRFARREIDVLEAATVALNTMCLEAVEQVIAENRFAEFLIPPALVPWIKRSWEEDEISICGRFDLVHDGQRPPQLLEYNADTPTSLVEAAVVQWHWLQDVSARDGLKADQVNSIHDRLLEAWRRALYEYGAAANGRMAFAGLGLQESVEDFVTLAYHADLAGQAGWQTLMLGMADIGFDARRRRFVDRQQRPLDWCFKLYPWEWMANEAFGRQLPTAPTRWLEPPWKMLLSNKMLLVVLAELFPQSPYLLRCAREPFGPTYVRKPLLSREGANVAVIHEGVAMVETAGPYHGPCICQEFRALPSFDGQYAVVGSWLVNGHACGLGLREDPSLVTGNASRFVPHYFVP